MGHNNTKPPAIALVSGGASGMGRIYALRMARAGAQVAVLDRSEQALEALAAESNNILALPCDVTELSQVQACIARTQEQLGPIDRLAHCAAIMPAGTLIDHPIPSIQQLMSVNYGGTVNVVNSMLPLMQARQSGEIIVFGSLGGHLPVPECGAYCASKAAVNAYTETLIAENPNDGVHIMLVCPSLVDTPLLQQATDTGNPSSVSYSVTHRRFATPDAIIDAVEKGLQRKVSILYPSAEAKTLAWLRRFSPSLMWKLILATNKATANASQ